MKENKKNKEEASKDKIEKIITPKKVKKKIKKNISSGIASV